MLLVDGKEVRNNPPPSRLAKQKRDGRVPGEAARPPGGGGDGGADGDGGDDRDDRDGLDIAATTAKNGGRHHI